MGIVQIRPGSGVLIFRRDLRQGVDPLPVLEGDHGHSDAIGHKGQLQPGKQLRHVLCAAQRIEIHRLCLPGIADTVQRTQALTSKSVSCQIVATEGLNPSKTQSYQAFPGL